MKKILVIDDDQNISKSLMIRLKSAGFDVDLAHDGVSGTKQAINGEPDLILLDLSMPAGDGHSVLERLNSNPATTSIPVFVMTASKTPGLCERVLKNGARVFFEKPFDSEQLLESIENEFGIHFDLEGLDADFVR